MYFYSVCDVIGNNNYQLGIILEFVVIKTVTKTSPQSFNPLFDYRTMGFLLELKKWFHQRRKQDTRESEQLPDFDTNPSNPIEAASLSSTTINTATENVSDSAELSEEAQQLEQIKALIHSDDLSNHQLAAMFMQSLEVTWEEDMYQAVAASANKMTFWAEQEGQEDFLQHFKQLVITPRFFGQYQEIAAFAEVLPRFSALEELHWKAKHYWNQHPIMVAAGQLPQLKRLYAESCGMHFLPEQLAQVSTLEELYLGNNKLTELPESLEQLTNLRILDLSGNAFKRFPRAICNVRKLEVLRLHDTPITDIEPRVLGRLYRLRDLQLSAIVAKFNMDHLQDWLPDVDFDKPYWKFDG